MSLYVEHWIARPAWLALSISDRLAFLDRIGPDMDRFSDAGAELIGVALRETKMLHRSDCDYIALWSMPEGHAQVQELDSILERIGWSDFFDRGGVEPAELASVTEPSVTEPNEAPPRLGHLQMRAMENGQVV